LTNIEIIALSWFWEPYLGTEEQNGKHQKTFRTRMISLKMWSYTAFC